MSAEASGPGSPGYPVDLIDQARDAYAAKRIDRATALGRIRDTGLNLTPAGVADLLDHRLSAATRYAASFGPGR